MTPSPIKKAATPMNLRAITSELMQLLELTREWEATSNIPEIEREIAIDKLKQVYSLVKGLTPEAAKPASNDSTANSDLRSVFFEIQEDVLEKQEPVSQSSAKTISDIEALIIPDFQPIKNSRSKEEEPKQEEQRGLTVEEASPILASISNLAGTINSNAKAAEEKIEKQASPEPKEEVKPIEHPTEKPIKQPEPAPEPVVKAETQKKEESHPTEKANKHSKETTHKHQSESPRVGEVFEGTKTFLNEVISPNRQPDLASKLQNQHVSDLRKAISFNDKFFLIKELFTGDAAAYESAITALNDQPSLDHALIYIQEHYSWDASSDAAKRLIELLQRKHS